MARCISPVPPTEAGWAPTISHLDQSSPTSFFPSRLAIFKTPSKTQPEGLCSHPQLIFVPFQLFSSPITLHFLLAVVKFMSTHAHTPQSKNTNQMRSVGTNPSKSALWANQKSVLCSAGGCTCPRQQGPGWILAPAPYFLAHSLHTLSFSRSQTCHRPCGWSLPAPLCLFTSCLLCLECRNPSNFYSSFQTSRQSLS